VEIQSAETMISRKLFSTNDYIGWILDSTPYYNEKDDSVSFFEISKDRVGAALNVHNYF
jgi:hypothetical protein